MTAHLRYLRYVARHKWFVFRACCALGIPWRGILHDWSKFLPCEWFPYAQYFYGKPLPSYRDFYGDVREMHLSAGCTREQLQERFDAAWLHHQHANKHHWQHFVLREDDGGTKALRMPQVYMREMLADWRGAGRALGFPDTAAWYVKNRENIVLHPQTREWIEGELGVA